MYHATDFHFLNAIQWGCSRQSAKQGVFGPMYSSVDEPRFLDHIHPENRATILASRGIILGVE